MALISSPLTLGTWRIAANRGLSPGVSTATTTLELRAARPRLPGPAPPTKSIIQSKQAGQLVISIARRHGLADLMPHDPTPFYKSGFPRSVAKTTWKRHFSVVPSGKSSRTIFSGASWSYEKLRCRQRGLVITSFAGIYNYASDERKLVMLTARAPITLRPTQLKNMFLTSSFAPKPNLKRQETSAFLSHNISRFTRLF